MATLSYRCSDRFNPLQIYVRFRNTPLVYKAYFYSFSLLVQLRVRAVSFCLRPSQLRDFSVSFNRSFRAAFAFPKELPRAPSRTTFQIIPRHEMERGRGVSTVQTMKVHKIPAESLYLLQDNIIASSFAVAESLSLSPSLSLFSPLCAGDFLTAS